MKRMQAIAAIAMAGWILSCAPPFVDAALDIYEIDVTPEPSQIIPVAIRPDEPFVMANLLVFREFAVGEGFEGLTGEEAYGIYTDGLQEAQMALGSRLVWAGDVRSQIVGSSDPVFDVIALLEYASPTAFFTFAGSPGDAPEARAAGLLGQWLVASTTLDERDAVSPPAPVSKNPPKPHPGCDAPGKATKGPGWSSPTGLSHEQVCRLLEGPADEPVAIVELHRFSDGTGERYAPYRDALAAVVAAKGGEAVWRGSLDLQAIGAASPSFDELVVTLYPNPRAYLSTLAHPEVVAASSARIEGLELHWIYAADDTTAESGL